jgi:glyoxylase-like metal-dependent hydrolase (beta-lactamase superfamily II)
MGGPEYEYLLYTLECIPDSSMHRFSAPQLAGGFPEEFLRPASENNPARIFMSSRAFPVTKVSDGDELRVGSVKLEVVSVPGHTPGQMILYIPEEKILFSADHVLFDITPNITCWSGVRDPLGQYLKSLDKILTYDVKTVFPGHRSLSNKTLEQRVQEIKEHHERRLNEVRAVLREHPGANAYEVASRLTWSLHGATWETAPKSQLWFAVGETIAHMDYLREHGG